MHDKLFVLIPYVFFGLALGLWPHFIAPKHATVNGKYTRTFDTPSWVNNCALLALVIGVIVLEDRLMHSLISVSIIILALASAYINNSPRITIFLITIFALCISATLPWWRSVNEYFIIDNTEIFIFSTITGAVLFLYSSREKFDVYFSWPSLILFVAIACILTFWTGLYIDINTAKTAWHHWGAYIGPAELLKSGAAIFYDFPAQYGLGPSALISATCGDDCWRSMYFVAGGATLLYAILIASMAIKSSCGGPERLVIIVLLSLATCFFWNAYPPNVGTALMTPSVAGLRFLPATALTAFLLFNTDVEKSNLKLFIAYGLWIGGLIWSPESAYYSTFVWWPYYLLIFRVQGNATERLMGFAYNALRLFFITLIIFSAFILVYWLTYNQMPTLYGFLAYVIDPPGPLPINPHGAILFAATVALAGLLSNLHIWINNGDTSQFRNGFLLLLLNFAVFSYFLGRSHDNNLLNLLPFSLLVMLQTIASTQQRTTAQLFIVFISTLLGWLSIFGWQAWSGNIKSVNYLSFKSDDVINKFSLPTEQEDATSLILSLQREFHEPVTFLDSSHMLMRHKPSEIWSAINSTSTFTFMPSSRRRVFLERSASYFQKSGWLIVDKRFDAKDWLADFDTAYNRGLKRDLGNFTAIQYIPKK